MAESKFSKDGFYPTNDFPNVIPGEAGREVRFEIEAKERKSMDVNIKCDPLNAGLFVTKDDIYVFTPDEKVRIAKQQDDLRSAFSASVDEFINRFTNDDIDARLITLDPEDIE